MQKKVGLASHFCSNFIRDAREIFYYRLFQQFTLYSSIGIFQCITLTASINRVKYVKPKIATIFFLFRYGHDDEGVVQRRTCFYIIRAWYICFVSRRLHSVSTGMRLDVQHHMQALCKHAGRMSSMHLFEFSK